MNMTLCFLLIPLQKVKTNKIVNYNSVNYTFKPYQNLPMFKQDE